MFSTIDLAVLKELAQERELYVPSWDSFGGLVAEGFAERITSGLIVKTPLVADYFRKRGWRILSEDQHQAELAPGTLVYVLVWGAPGTQPVREVDGELVWSEVAPRYFFQYRL